MMDWWNSLAVEMKFFYFIGITSMMVVVVQLLLTLVGFDSDGVDGGFDPDVGDFDHGSGIGLFSTQTLAAFFVAFGWIGVVALKVGLGTFGAGALAFGCGVISMYVMFHMLRGLLRLQGKGNLEYSNAIGEEGSVYVTIPANDADGGQIQVNIQGRLTTAAARTKEADPIKPGQRVRIVATTSPTSFEVESIKSSAS